MVLPIHGIGTQNLRLNASENQQKDTERPTDGGPRRTKAPLRAGSRRPKQQKNKGQKALQRFCIKP